MTVRVQIAGVSSLRKPVAAADAGCDALGFTVRLLTGVHDELTEAKARGIVAALPPFVASVAITYVDTPREAVRALPLPRRHGAAAPRALSDARRSGRPRRPAAASEDHPRRRTSPGRRPSRRRAALARQVDALILDTYDPTTGRHGATGKTHDWEISRAIGRRGAGAGDPRRRPRPTTSPTRSRASGRGASTCTPASRIPTARATSI